MERFKLECAVCLILTKKEKTEEYVLLQRRYNTGIWDGLYDVSVCGHLEKNETIKEALLRETKEEIGIEINEKDLKFVSVMQAKVGEEEYIFVTFSTDKYKGSPSIMEPNKCNELSWYDIKDLPSDIINTRKCMIENYLDGVSYYEYGFEKIKNNEKI